MDINIQQDVFKSQSDRVTINEVILDEKVIKVLSNSDCLVFPSWNEEQPLVILEAISQGLIVFSTKVGLISEMLGDDYPFYFENNNTKSLELCLKKFINYNFKKKISLSSSLKERYNKNFSQLEHKIKLIKVSK